MPGKEFEPRENDASLDIIPSNICGVKCLEWWFHVSAVVAWKSCSIMVARPEAES